MLIMFMLTVNVNYSMMQMLVWLAELLLDAIACCSYFQCISVLKIAI